MALKVMVSLTNLLYYLVFFTTIESEKSIAKSSRMVWPCDTVRIAIKNEIMQTRHHGNMKRSFFINPTMNKQV